MEEDTYTRSPSRISTAKLSKTPSWIMLGFALGAAFMKFLPPLRKAEPARAPASLQLEFTKPSAPPQPRPLTVIEDVFAEWGQNAVWFDGVTEVALWNSADKAFSDCYEVRRVGDLLYFRTIPRLTRRIITHGKPMPESPLQFTETEEQYREWYEHGRTERPQPAQNLRPAAPTAAPSLPPPVAERATSPLDAIPGARPPSKP